MNNKQTIRNFIAENNINQTEAGLLFGVKRNTLSNYISAREGAITPPKYIYVLIDMYNKNKELELKLSKVDNLEGLIAKYDKIKALMNGVEGV
jgi:hypothetical protein